MTNKIITAVAVLIILGFGAYAITNSGIALPKDVPQSSVSNTSAPITTVGDSTNTPPSNTSGKSSIAWSFRSAGEVDGIPYTNVSVVVNGKTYDAGKYTGSCNEIGANGYNGIDGKGLLIGELSAVQCWYAGGGDEIGVFAHEDGGFDILAGKLGEGEEGAGVFRGDFKSKHTILK